MNVVYCGFDFFHECLLAIASGDNQIKGVFSHEVDGVYNSNAKMQSTCIELGLRLQVRKLTVDDITQFKADGVDVLITAAYRFRVPANELANAGIKAINVHPSLLPVGRGPWPLPVVILRGEKHSGITFHKLSPEFDSGEIMLQERFDLAPCDNLETVSCRSQILAAKMMPQMINNLDSLWNSARMQGDGEYWPMPTEAERSLNWCKPVAEIDRVIRAFGNFDSYANFDGVDWLVQNGTVWQEPHGVKPGTVVHRATREIVVAALDGFVCLRSFRPERNV